MLCCLPQISLTDEEKLQLATEELARRRNDAAVRTVADDLEGASSTSPQRAALSGGATMIGSGLGALAGMTVGENLLGGGWATSLGTMIGMGIGGKASSTIALAFADSMSAGGSIFTAMGAAASALGPVLGLGVAGLAIAAGYALWKKHQEKLTEEAKTAFTDAAEELTNAKSLQATAQKYDELSKGVQAGMFLLLMRNMKNSLIIVINQQKHSPNCVSALMKMVMLLQIWATKWKLPLIRLNG